MLACIMSTINMLKTSVVFIMQPGRQTVGKHPTGFEDFERQSCNYVYNSGVQ